MVLVIRAAGHQSKLPSSGVNMSIHILCCHQQLQGVRGICRQKVSVKTLRNKQNINIFKQTQQWLQYFRCNLFCNFYNAFIFFFTIHINAQKFGSLSWNPLIKLTLNVNQLCIVCQRQCHSYKSNLFLLCNNLSLESRESQRDTAIQQSLYRLAAAL